MARTRRSRGTVNEHRDVADEERVSGDILDLWERGLHDPTAATIDECRRLQDCNYIKRSRGPLVPDWWYWWFRDRDESNMRTTMAELRATLRPQLPQPANAAISTVPPIWCSSRPTLRL
jgi:hypothetical protein